MATPTIVFTPSVYNLVLYAGDGAAILLSVTDKEGSPVDVTGVVTAQVKVDRDALTSDADFDADLANHATGQVLLTLTGAATEQLGDYSGVWDVQWTPVGREPVTLLQGAVKCGLDVTRP